MVTLLDSYMKDASNSDAALLNYIRTKELNGLRRTGIIRGVRFLNKIDEAITTYLSINSPKPSIPNKLAYQLRKEEYFASFLKNLYPNQSLEETRKKSKRIGRSLQELLNGKEVSSNELIQGEKFLGKLSTSLVNQIILLEKHFPSD